VEQTNLNFGSHRQKQKSVKLTFGDMANGILQASSILW